MAGTIFKKMDPYRLFKVTLQDGIELLHMMSCLGFVLAEQSLHAQGLSGAQKVLRQAAIVLASEFLVDIAKHAFTSKQNELRPGLYSEFLRDLCQMKLGSRAHNVHRVLNMNPLAAAALLVRLGLVFARAVSRSSHMPYFQKAWMPLVVCIIGG